LDKILIGPSVAACALASPSASTSAGRACFVENGIAVPSAAWDGAPQASPASRRWQEQIKQKMQIGNAILDRQFVAGIKNVAYPQLLLKKKLSGEPSRVLPQGLSGAVG
jgi:hypothetical protein